jgi:hypothetical protein
MPTDEHDEGIRFMRGFLYALPLAVVMWLVGIAVIGGLILWLVP